MRPLFAINLFQLLELEKSLEAKTFHQLLLFQLVYSPLIYYTGNT